MVFVERVAFKPHSRSTGSVAALLERRFRMGRNNSVMAGSAVVEVA
jgi:hypothetical protein